jgi:hypothetical protein
MLANKSCVPVGKSTLLTKTCDCNDAASNMKWLFNNIKDAGVHCSNFALNMMTGIDACSVPHRRKTQVGKYEHNSYSYAYALAPLSEHKVNSSPPRRLSKHVSTLNYKGNIVHSPITEYFIVINFIDDCSFEVKCMLRTRVDVVRQIKLSAGLAPEWRLSQPCQIPCRTQKPPLLCKASWLLRDCL